MSLSDSSHRTQIGVILPGAQISRISLNSRSLVRCLSTFAEKHHVASTFKAPCFFAANGVTSLLDLGSWSLGSSARYDEASSPATSLATTASWPVQLTHAADDCGTCACSWTPARTLKRQHPSLSCCQHMYPNHGPEDMETCVAEEIGTYQGYFSHAFKPFVAQ